MGSCKKHKKSENREKNKNIQEMSNDAKKLKKIHFVLKTWRMEWAQQDIQPLL